MPALLSLPLRSSPAGYPERATAAPSRAATYQNPLVRDVADPFVLKHRGEYYLYRTAIRGELDVLLSRDLVHWRPGPVVWKPDSADAENARLIWAPEVYYENGTFYLYFNADGPEGTGQRLWLATADNPLGPFRTHPGGPLTGPWRIDVSVFRDDDGARYLYGCRQESVAGELTGRARVEGRRISAPWERAEGGWQPMLGGQDSWEGRWTEAPTVLKDDSGYYLLYSWGGAHLPGYRVSYATAPHPLGPWTKQGTLIPHLPPVPGPGHQAVALAPDNLTPYLVYHRKRLAQVGWHRDLMLDRLAIGGGKLSTRAPTVTPQPAPPRPAFEDHFDGDASRASWTMAQGKWKVDAKERELTQTDRGVPGRARLTKLKLSDGVIEVNLRRLAGDGALGLALSTPSARLPIVLFPEGSNALRIGATRHTLAEGIQPGVHHQLLVTRRGDSVEVRLDGRRVGQAALAPGPATLDLVTDGCAGAFSGVAVTTYTRPLPLGPPDPAGRGWHRSGDRIEQRALGLPPQVHRLERALPASGTLTVRAQGWALGTSSRFPKYGVRISSAGGSDYVEAYIDPTTAVLATHAVAGGRDLAWQNSELPVGFEFTDWHELKITWGKDRWQFAVDGGSAQERRMPPGQALRGPLRPALVTEDARAVFREITIRGSTAPPAPATRRRPPANAAPRNFTPALKVQ